MEETLFGETYYFNPVLGNGYFERIVLDPDIEMAILREANSYSLTETAFECQDEYLELGFIYQGSCYLEVPCLDKSYFIGENDMFIYRMHNDVEYFNTSFKNCLSISIKISPKLISHPTSKSGLDEWLNMMDSCFGDDFLMIKKGDDGIRNLFETINAVKVENAMGLIGLKTHVMSFIHQIIDKFLNSEYDDDELEVEKMVSYIEDNLSEVIHLKDIGDYMDMSLYQIQKLFKVHKQCTVRQYIITKRLEHAMFMLLNTEMSILEIANESGYENPSKFASAFKNHYCMSPLRYRKTHKKPNIKKMGSI